MSELRQRANGGTEPEPEPKPEPAIAGDDDDDDDAWEFEPSPALDFALAAGYFAEVLWLVFCVAYTTIRGTVSGKNK